MSGKNTVFAAEAVENDANQNKVEPIFEFVKSNAEKIEFCDKKKIVIVMGDTGAGKTTLVSLITKQELRSEQPTALEEYIIKDPNNQLISGLSTTVSKTMIPNLMVHETTNTTYYDCPGFNDSRDVSHDISVSYFTRKLIKRASAVKFVFVIPYNSVKIANGNRHGFLNLAKHATTFIKNIDKYKDGIALVVTMVPPVNKNDQKIIDVIASFLSDARAHLNKKISEIQSEVKKKVVERKIKFITILLKENDDRQFERIAILRLPNQTGPVAGMGMIQTERRYIKNMIHERLRYVKKEDSDFGYTVSDEYKDEIHQLVEHMELCLINDVKCIGSEFKRFYLDKEKNIVDMQELKNMFLNAYQKVLHVEYDQLILFKNKLVNTAATLNIELSASNRKRFSDDIELINFLQCVSNLSLSSLFHISEGLTDLKAYLKESCHWYNFLLALHDHLSAYDVQKNAAAYFPRRDKIIKFGLNIDLEELSRDIGCEVYYMVKGITLNCYKLNTLKLVLNQALDNSLKIECSSDTLTVKGYNVKISDIGLWKDTVKFVEVFALNNLFIDADIIKIGQNAQVSFIAPKWYIIGDRQINLNGEDGEPHSESPLERAKDGVPGKPGGAAGNFLGIGKKSFCDQYLKIYMNGGKGGPGQDGAKGMGGSLF